MVAILDLPVFSLKSDLLGLKVYPSGVVRLFPKKSRVSGGSIMVSSGFPVRSIVTLRVWMPLRIGVLVIMLISGLDGVTSLDASVEAGLSLDASCETGVLGLDDPVGPEVVEVMFLEFGLPGLVGLEFVVFGGRGGVE